MTRSPTFITQTVPSRRPPSDTARKLRSKWGLESAIQFAHDRVHSHPEGSSSRRYWRDVLAFLRKAKSMQRGTPSKATRAARRKSKRQRHEARAASLVSHSCNNPSTSETDGGV